MEWKKPFMTESDITLKRNRITKDEGFGVRMNFQ